jgi:hypothetical protein
MASGMLTKQADQLTARFLNDVNDAVSGGSIVSLPAGVTGPAVSATIPGDKIVMDDITAAAYSDTAVGTLYGGVFMYVGTLSSSAATPARGTACFYRAADLPPAFAAPLYQVTADAQPTTAIPTLFAGVFINAVTKGNYCWIQLGGVASCLFDSAITAAAVGNPVSVKISAAVASTFDVGVNVVTATIPFSYAGAFAGTAIVLPVISTVTQVLLQRNPFSRI